MNDDERRITDGCVCGECSEWEENYTPPPPKRKVRIAARFSVRGRGKPKPYPNYEESGQ